MFDYDFDDLNDALMNGAATLVCTECNEEVGEGEPDCRGVQWKCPCCGADGKHIMSILVIEGVI